MPAEVEVHTVPNIQAPDNGKVKPRWLECASTFSIHTSFLKIGRLLHKSGFVESQSFTSVLEIIPVNQASYLVQSDLETFN